MSIIKKDFYEPTPNDANTPYNSEWYAMVFTANSSYFMNKLDLKLARFSTPGTVTVRIRAVSGGVPSGSDLATATCDGDALPLLVDYSEAATELTLSVPVYIAAGTQYAILVTAPDAPGDGSKYVWFYNLAAGGYSGGSTCHSGDSGANWHTHTTDNWFQTYGGSQIKKIVGLTWEN